MITLFDKKSMITFLHKKAVIALFDKKQCFVYVFNLNQIKFYCNIFICNEWNNYTRVSFDEHSSNVMCTNNPLTVD